jgi:hypothetical protein
MTPRDAIFFIFDVRAISLVLDLSHYRHHFMIVSSSLHVCTIAKILYLEEGSLRFTFSIIQKTHETLLDILILQL